MKKIVTSMLILLLLGACTGRTIFKKPDDLISKEQMVDIWTDIYIASAAKNTKTKSLEKNIDYIPLVLEKYKIDSLQFSESNFYYTTKIEDYEKMFAEVQERLEGMKNAMQPKNRRDSLINRAAQDKLEPGEELKEMKAKKKDIKD